MTMKAAGREVERRQRDRERLPGRDHLKDFRTWAGTVLAAMALNEVKTFDSAAQAKRNFRSAIENVARAWATRLPSAANVMCIRRY